MFLLSSIPINFLQLLNNTVGSGFVNKYATWSRLPTCTSSTFPSFTCSRMKWKCTSMCLLLSWLTGFFTNSMADLLSTRIIVPSSCFISSLLRRFLSHTAWHIHHDAATYSASHVDNVTMDCFFESQVNVMWPMKNTYLNVFFRSSTSLHQSLSEYPTSW